MMQRMHDCFKWLALAGLTAGVLALTSGALEDDDGPLPTRFLMSLSRGTLVICGGGEISEDVLHEFFAAAGGDKARVVVITTASDRADSEEIEEELGFWRKQKLSRLTVLHTRSRETADDPEFASPLADATGVWFVGGKQAHLADTYVGTACDRLLHGVLERGGVVGGVSAGAAVMSPVMIRAGETSPEIGKGFGLLPGTLIDQHFLARNRQERLLGALSEHPELVGLGIDERAAVVVRGSQMNVMGKSQVAACIWPSPDRDPKVEMLRPGQKANLLALSQAANRSRPRRTPLRTAGSSDTGGD